MIREALETDIPALVPMGRRFFECAGLAAVAGWDDASFAATLRQLILSNDGVLLVIDDSGPVGMAGALLYPFYFNTAQQTGQELFWWVEPESRGRVAVALLDTLERLAQERGASSFTMISVDGLRSDELARLYRGRGYKPIENTFIKRL